MNVIFVYQHKNTCEIRVEYIEKARALEGDSNWLHIGTLEPAAYVKTLLTEYPALVRKMKGENV